MKRIHIVVIIALVLVLSAIGLALYGYNLQKKYTANELTVEERANLQAQHRRAYYDSFFSSLPVQARAIYIQNLTTNEVVYEKNSTTPLPLASLAKIMTAITALAYIDPSTVVTFSEQAVAQIGDQGFRIGERISLDRLLPFMMVTSSNDAGQAIAETVETITNISFTESMNTQAQNLGFTSLSFQNATGLDIVSPGSNPVPSAQGTAADVARMLVFATRYYPEYMNQSSAAGWNIGTHRGANTNILTNRVPGFLVSKTGFTNKSRGNLAFIVEIGPHQPYVVVLMSSTFDGRFSDAETIINALYTVVGTTPDAL